jgi:glycosyltransferase involved in cell wall biosynthesis
MADAVPIQRLRRLLVLLPSTRLGGTERHTLEAAARLGARGLGVTLAADPALLAELAVALPAGWPAPTLLPAAIGWQEESPADLAAARQAAGCAALLAELARLRATPDAVLLALPWPNAGLGLQRALAAGGLPRLLLLHLAADGPIPDGIEAMRPALGLAATQFAAVSAPLARRAARAFGLAETAVTVLPNPAPAAAPLDRAQQRRSIRQMLGLGAGARLVLFLGRLEEAKGADLLPAISERLPVTLACAGDGPLRGLLAARATGDPRGLLRVLGPLADPAPWLAGADALILPSRLEGAPLVFLEAAAQRCPVVATAAALEALGAEAHHLARVVEAPDPTRLAAATVGLLADPAGAAAMVEAAASHAAARHWPAAIEGLLGLLRAAMLHQSKERMA